jgi:hypothetical protein
MFVRSNVVLGSLAARDAALTEEEVEALFINADWADISAFELMPCVPLTEFARMAEGEVLEPVELVVVVVGVRSELMLTS